MRVTFAACAFESLSIEYLSAVLRAHGHETALAFDPALFSDSYLDRPLLAQLFSYRDRILDRIVRQRPDLIAFSVMTDNYRWGVELAARVKTAVGVAVPIIFGGIHPTSVPDRVLANDAVDMVCVGEGEKALLDLVASLERDPGRVVRDGEDKEHWEALDTSIQNIWFKRYDGAHRHSAAGKTEGDGEGDGRDDDKSRNKNESKSKSKNAVAYRIVKNRVRPQIQDLDTLPFPHKRLFYHEAPHFMREYFIISGRGCAFNCSYCCNNILRRTYRGTPGKFLRRRSVDNVLSELHRAIERFPLRQIHFVDDIFIIDEGWVGRFCERYRDEIGLPFKCFTHPHYVTEELIAMISAAGASEVQMGVQTWDESLRRTVLNRPETNAEILRAGEIINKYGLHLIVDHIAGLPGASSDQLVKDAIMYNRLRPERINFFWLKYFPLTQIIEHALAAGQVDEETLAAIEEGYGPSYHAGGSVLDRATVKEYEQFQALFTVLPDHTPEEVERMLESGSYRHLPRSYLRTVALPRVKNMLRAIDPRIKTHLIHYLRYILRLMRPTP